MLKSPLLTPSHYDLLSYFLKEVSKYTGICEKKRVRTFGGPEIVFLSLRKKAHREPQW